MATIALLASSCHLMNKNKRPITKPEITIEGGRLTPEALWAMGRINSVHPDEQTGQIAYTISYYSVKENHSTSWIRIAKEIPQKEIKDSTQLLEVTDEFIGHSPAWHDGKLCYINKDNKLVIRHKSKLNFAKEEKISDFDHEIEGFLMSPNGKQVILITQVKANATTADKYPDLPLASGRVIDDLMYKHWDEWTETAPHPFLCTIDEDLEVSECIDLLEGTPYESPMKPFGGIEQLAWSPDGKQLAYTCRKKIGLDYAVSTNSDIYIYDIETGTHTNLTEDNQGYDTNPAYSPDGQWIAWQSMERDGYESDENRLMIQHVETGEKRFLTRGMQTNVDAFYWKDENNIVFNAVWHGTTMLYEVNIHPSNDSTINTFHTTCLTKGQYDFVPGGNIDNKYYCLRHSMCEANEIFAFTPTPDTTITQLTYENANIYSQIKMGHVEPRWQTTSDGKKMLTWIIYPPQFDPNKKYPTLLYCEGGPQSPVSQFWSFRWNFMMMAANDYIVVAPNRRGLPGFGNEWNEQISGDYGGQCMKDYLTAIDEFANEPYVDKDRLGCVGASFGGFSVYWLAGHHNKRFKAFIAHDGIFNMEMQYLETEEKWFANWDMGGAYWDKDNQIAQNTFANSPHRFVDKWDTPILCIHGEKDYRILANQGMAAFDAAKMRGVDAQLLIFPDENHWVLKPQNGILWQRTFFSWLDKYLK
jgi:dipeptidyl aminopeptidase/acylaminoacyl peptidase